ncbi:hypothetical protein Pelo_8330 [Pelomyxa schiedti]|nr:hypothetical protein Pelo_8330 [Pelomyxa schiedti]
MGVLLVAVSLSAWIAVVMGNNDCGSAIAISPLPFVYEGSVDTVSTDIFCVQSYTTQGMWFSYTASEATRLSASTCFPEPVLAPYLAVAHECGGHTANDCETVTNRDCTQGRVGVAAQWIVEAGETSWLYVTFDDYYMASLGAFTLTVQKVEDYVGNTCSEAISITEIPFYFLGNTENQLSSQFSCPDTTVSKGMWFTWTPSTTSMVMISTCNADTTFDTTIYVFTSCDAGSGEDCVTFSNEFCSFHFGGQLIWNAIQNTQYYILISGDDTQGSFGLNLQAVESHCDTALSIPELPFSHTDYTDSLDYALFSCPSFEAHKGQWFTYTTVSTATLVAMTCSEATNFNTDIFIFNSCDESGDQTCSTFEKTKCNYVDYMADSAVMVKWEVQAGQTSFILVTGQNDEVGRFNLTVYEDVPGSSCATPIPLIGGLPIIRYSTTLYDTPSSSLCDDDDSVQGSWFSYTAVEDGLLSASTCNGTGVDMYATLQVMLQCINGIGQQCISDIFGHSTTTETVSWWSTKGETYLIFVIYEGIYGQSFFKLSLSAVEYEGYNCSSPLAITGIPFSSEVTIKTHGSSQFFCSAPISGEAMWVSYTVLNNGVLSASTCGSDSYAFEIYAFDNCLSQCISTTSLHCQATTGSKEVWRVSQGDTYIITVAQNELYSYTEFDLNLYEYQIGIGSTCHSAVVVEELPFVLNATLLDQPSIIIQCVEENPVYGIWLSFTPNASMLVSASTCCNTGYPKVSLLNSCEDYSSCHQPDYTHEDQLSWNLIEGTTYYFLIYYEDLSAGLEDFGFGIWAEKIYATASALVSSELLYVTFSVPSCIDYTQICSFDDWKSVTTAEIIGGDTSTFYSLEEDGCMYTYSTIDCTSTVTPLTGLELGYQFSGITWSAANHTMYAVATTGMKSSLYTVDTRHATVNRVCEIPVEEANALASNGQGSLYTYYNSANTLIKIWVLPGFSGCTTEYVGWTGSDVSLLDMDFDLCSGILYAVGGNTLYQIDPTNAFTTISSIIPVSTGDISAVSFSGCMDDCAPTCVDIYVGDGECDPGCNIEACNWDGGDCDDNSSVVFAVVSLLVIGLIVSGVVVAVLAGSYLHYKNTKNAMYIPVPVSEQGRDSRGYGS